MARNHDSLWKEFFRDPSQWWDRRCSKSGLAHPYFKHKVTKEPLWIHGWHTPPWVFEELRRRGLAEAPDRSRDDSTAFVALLRACAKNKDLSRGTRVHEDLVKRGLFEGCSDALVTMYAKCGALARAKELFDVHKCRDVLTWTAIIAACTQKNLGQDALNYFEQMEHHGLLPDAVTFTCVLKACGSLGALDKGEKIHDELKKQALLGSAIELGNVLVDMYAKCGALVKAREVLEELPARNVITWTSLIAGYANQGEGAEALCCLEEMRREGLSPNAVTFIFLLKACGSLKAADKGEALHNDIANYGLLQNNTVLGNAVVDMYAKCGAFNKARNMLEEIAVRNVVSWNAIMVGYAQQDEGERTLLCFEEMMQEGIPPNVVTFTCLLKACGSIQAVDKGKEFHDEIVKQGLLENNAILGTALVDMYTKCGDLAKAQSVHEELPVRSVTSWNALISGHAEEGEGLKALDCYESMLDEGFSPDMVTFTCLLKACGRIRAAEKGGKFHDEIAKQGLLRNSSVLGNALLDMYVKCGALAKARQLLEDLPIRNEISWSILIGGYAEYCHGEEALSCFQRMQGEGLCPDVVTFICLLKACGSIGSAEKGERIHDEIAKQGLLLQNDTMLGAAVVDMYAKCNALAKAREVLEELHVRTVTSWTALIAGCAQHGEGLQALDCFYRMLHDGHSPNAMTFTCVLKACASIGAVEEGERIHAYMAKEGQLGNNVVLSTALMDMYIRCGVLAKGRRVLEELPVRDVIFWNALIAGYAQLSDGAKAFVNIFGQMQHEGFCPDAATFSCMLSACSHLGLVDYAAALFVSIRTKFGMEPDLEHYACMVDLFGRIGHLSKAVEVIEKIPSSDSEVWSTLLGACQKWVGVNVGSLAFEHAVCVYKCNLVLHDPMANMYRVSCMQEEAEFIEAMRNRTENGECCMDNHSFLSENTKMQLNHVHTNFGD